MYPPFFPPPMGMSVAFVDFVTEEALGIYYMVAIPDVNETVKIGGIQYNVHGRSWNLDAYDPDTCKIYLYRVSIKEDAG